MTDNTATADNEPQAPADKAPALPEALKAFDALPDSAHVRLPTVCGLFGISPATAWRWVRAERLPAPKKLSPGVSAWNVGEIRAAQRAAA